MRMGVGLQDFCVCNTWGGCAFGWAAPELSQHLSFPDSGLFTGSALFTLQGFAGFQFVNLLQRLCCISVMNGSKALLREWSLLLEKSNYLGRAAPWSALPLSPSCCTGAKGDWMGPMALWMILPYSWAESLWRDSGNQFASLEGKEIENTKAIYCLLNLGMRGNVSSPKI